MDTGTDCHTPSGHWLISLKNSKKSDHNTKTNFNPQSISVYFFMQTYERVEATVDINRFQFGYTGTGNTEKTKFFFGFNSFGNKTIILTKTKFFFGVCKFLQ